MIFFPILKLRGLLHQFPVLAITPVVLTRLGALMVDREKNTGRLQELPQRRGFSTAFLNYEITKKLQVMLKVWAESAGHSSRAACLCRGQEGQEHTHVSVHSHPLHSTGQRGSSVPRLFISHAEKKKRRKRMHIMYEVSRNQHA